MSLYRKQLILGLEPRKEVGGVLSRVVGRQKECLKHWEHVRSPERGYGALGQTVMAQGHRSRGFFRGK